MTTLTQPSWTLHTGSTPPKAKHRVGSLCDRGVKYHERVYRELRKTGLKLHVEPWLRHIGSGMLRQPDAVALLPRMALVIEVKMNWRRGRDQKLRDTYLQAVQDAFEVERTRPLMIVQCVRGLLKGEVHRNMLEAMKASITWEPKLPVPVLLLP